MTSRDSRHCAAALAACIGTLVVYSAPTPSAALLVLNKRENALAIVDPATLKVIGKVPAGQDPHEVVASGDGKFAYISNYGGGGGGLHTISVVDLVGQKALPPVDLGALRAPHGLAFASGRVYFTAETNKVIGRYDPSTGKVDWVLGIGQDRTHMVVVRAEGKQIFTSNVNSNTISMIEQTTNAGGPGPPPPGGQGGPPPSRGPGGGISWKETAITVGQGPEGFDVSPDGKEVWAANSHDGTVSIIDVPGKTVVQSIDAHIGFANRLKFTPDGKYVFVSGLGDGSLTIFDAAARKEVKRIQLGKGSAGILMQPDGSRAFVAGSRDNNIAVIDIKTLTVTGRFETGGEPDGLAWAARQ
jgi:YVTN family beta-propeller protein